MQKLIDRLREMKANMEDVIDTPNSLTVDTDILEEAASALERYRWIPATRETMPEEDGEYPCIMVDDRESESDDEWLEICHFKKSKAFGDKFQCFNFDRVIKWTHPPTR